VSDTATAPAAEAAATPGVSVSNHPRAVGSIRRTRARVGIAAFVLVLLLCLHAGVPGQIAVARALVAGIAGFVCSWMICVALWRQIVVAEVRRVHEARLARRRQLLEAASARREAGAK
jgi:hypothetical protein